MNALLRLMQGDPRSTQQVRDDLREEMQCHIDLMREELKADGIEGEEAERLITERFGDESHWRMKSESVILGERIMLQKILVALVLALAVGWGWSVFEARSSRMEIKRDMTNIQRQLEGLSGRLERAWAAAPNVQPEPRFVYVDGKLGRPGPYQLVNGLTLKRMLISAQIDLEKAKNVAITRKYVEGPKTTQFKVAEFMAQSENDPPLEADDMIQVW